MTWKVEVQADDSDKWLGNARRFSTEAEAKVYAFELMMAWTQVRNTRVVESDDPVNGI